MQTRNARSTVLGKRTARGDDLDSACSSSTLITPESSPDSKRAKKYLISPEDGRCNKENVPPFCNLAVDSSPPATPTRRTASLRRTTSDVLAVGHSRTTPRRHSTIAKIPCTPTTGLSKLAISTPPPTPPSLIAPLHVRARALLRATCNSSAQMIGREGERATIHDFLFSPISETYTSFSALYISGTPGTGKTALVNSIIRGADADEDRHVISVNCMALKDIESLWERLLQDLEVKASKSRGKKPLGRAAVEAALASSSQKRIVLLDELDHIATSSHDLQSIFSLGDEYSHCVRIVCIANTHTLTSSSSDAFDTHRICTIHFSAYGPDQLLEIVKSRLAPLQAQSEEASSVDQFLPRPVLTLLCKKVAAQTGDVRTVFEVLRRAIDLAVTSFPPVRPTTSKSVTLEDQDAAVFSADTAIPAVNPSHVLAALKAYMPASSSSRPSQSAIVATNASGVVSKVRNLGLQARTVLLSIALACMRLQAGLPIVSSANNSRSAVKSAPLAIPAIDIAQLHSFYFAMLSQDDREVFVPVGRSEFADLLGILEAAGLVSLSGKTASVTRSPSKASFKRSASFAGGHSMKTAQAQDLRLADDVRMEELLRGLGIGEDSAESSSTDVMQEELSAVWRREKSRIKTEVASREQSADGKQAFEDAVED